MFQKYLQLVRFSHTVFALPFALISALLAWKNEPFRWLDLIGILCCMVFARSAAMAFNRYVDRDLDALNARTANRHLPAGTLSPNAVLVFIVLTSVGFVASTLFFLPNLLPLYLSIPVLAFLFGYSYAKRFSMWCHYWLSAALMLSPIAAWIAICGTIDWPPVMIAAVVFFWVGGFDIIYACQDADFDQSQKLHSIPTRIGIRNALRVAMFSHLLMAGCLIGLWYSASLGFVFLAGCLAVIVLLIYEHSLVRPEDLSRVNLAFFHVNSVVSLGLLAVSVIDVVLMTN